MVSNSRNDDSEEGRETWAEWVANELRRTVTGNIPAEQKGVPPVVRVRNKVREVNPEDFEPQMLPMGLLHNERFQIPQPLTDKLPEYETTEDMTKRLRLQKANEYRLEVASNFVERSISSISSVFFEDSFLEDGFLNVFDTQ